MGKDWHDFLAYRVLENGEEEQFIVKAANIDHAVCIALEKTTVESDQLFVIEYLS